MDCLLETWGSKYSGWGVLGRILCSLGRWSGHLYLLRLRVLYGLQ